MDEKRRFDPEEYRGILNVYEDLSLYYELLDIYLSEKTKASRFALEKHSEDFFFTIKHRELEGQISHSTADEMRDYLREVLDD